MAVLLIILWSYALSDIEKDILSSGLDFGLPPVARIEEAKAEFELFDKQLSFNTPSSRIVAERLRIKLADIAAQYSSAQLDPKGFNLQREHMRARFRREDDFDTRESYITILYDSLADTKG